MQPHPTLTATPYKEKGPWSCRARGHHVGISLYRAPGQDAEFSLNQSERLDSVLQVHVCAKKSPPACKEAGWGPMPWGFNFSGSPMEPRDIVGGQCCVNGVKQD